MGDKTFNLTWNNHLANLSGLFEALYKSGSLTDTTLACQGGLLRAHRLVLAACSPYFERVFKEHYGEQPILILKGVSVEEMECLLDFMYRGSINVAEEHLPSLIKTATDLEIRGLSGDHRHDSNMYSRVETRLQGCHIETRFRPMDYRKTQCATFLSKENCGGSIEDGSSVKMEEIEVEDDPMVMESHEDSSEEPLPLASEQIRHIPPPMFKRHNTRFEGQKRIAIARNTRNNDNILKQHQQLDNNISSRNLISDEIPFNNVLLIDGIKSESTFNTSSDPTVPAIQMNDDSTDQERLNMDVPTTENLNEPTTKITDTNGETNVDKKTTINMANNAKERKTTLQRSKAQYKPFPCDLCTLAFTRASHLARHRRVHTGERPFACSLCPRMFARQDKLKQHLDSHLQWPKRKVLAGLGASDAQSTVNLASKGKRGRPRKISMEQSAMEEILKFGEFSSMLNKTQPMCARNDRSDACGYMVNEEANGINQKCND